MPFQCRVLPVTQPAATFYVASVPVDELLTICRPLYKPVEAGVLDRDTFDPVKLTEAQADALVQSLASRRFQSRITELLSEEPKEKYQRFVDAKRAQKIADYLESPGSILPNSIILAISLDLDEADVLKQSAADPDTLNLFLPRNLASAVILDGQHRVEAFRYLNQDLRVKMNVVTTFMVGIPFYQQAEIFAVINGRQKPVNRSIIFDLFGYAPLGNEKDERLYEGLMAVSRFCSHVARILNRFEESPWFNKIKMRGPGDVGVVSQAAVVQYLSALVEPKTYRQNLKFLPLLYNFFKESDPAGCASLLVLYLAAIRSAQSSFWSDKDSLLWKNNGVAVIMRVLHDDLMLAGGPQELMSNYSSIVSRWRKAPIGDLSNPPKSGGGGVQNEVYARFKAAMFERGELQSMESSRKAIEEKLINLRGLLR